KPIDRIVDARIGLAPKAPSLIGLQIGDCARQMIGPIPVLEFFAQGWVGHDRAHHENGLLHRLACPYSGRLSCFRAGIATCLVRSMASARQMRARVARGMITSSI